MPESTAPISSFRRLLRGLRMALLLFLFAIALLVIPGVFRFAVWGLVKGEAFRRGASVQIGEVTGSAFEPVALHRLDWTLRRRGEAVTQMDIARVEADFAWLELFKRPSGHWFRRLTLEGVTGKIEMPVGTVSPTPTPSPEAEAPPDWWPTPSRIEASGVDLLFQSEEDSVRVKNSRWMISEVEPGFVAAEQVEVKQPWLKRTFRNVHGTTALQDSTLSLANLTLDTAVQIVSFSAKPSEMARGRLDLGLLINAFGGEIHAQAQTIPHGRVVELDASGKFSQINIAAMANFLGVSDAAGGLIKEGNFTFRGSPREPERASGSVRLEATNFQWESRQWDSLALGATLLERRVQIPELELRQGHNQLSLSGDVALPLPHQAWWDSDFSLNIAARIGNLTELSALLLPDFKYAAGTMSVDGSVRGKDQQYFGALVVSGAGITWRNAPIQELRGAITLNGKELQLVNLDLLNKDDYVRGQGSISLGGPLEYHGELRASIEDLSTYAAIQEKPLVPHPLAGGAVVRWTGEGTAKGQTGRFFARLQRLRPLGSSDPLLHPVDVEMEGAYKPESLSFSRFGVADEECALTAQVEVAAKTLSLKGIRLTHGPDLWLEGDALLPLDIWQAWPKTAAVPLLAEDTPGKLALKATGLSLEPAIRLTGWKWPIQGIVDGAVTAEGTIGKLTSSGAFTVHDGRFTLGWNGPALSAVNGDFSLSEQAIAIQHLQASSDHDVFAPTGKHGIYEATGKIDFAHFRDPLLQLELQSNLVLLQIPWDCGVRTANRASGAGEDGMEADTTVNLQVDGPLSAALVHGKAEIRSIHPENSGAGTGLGHERIDISDFWRMPQLPEFPPLLQWTAPPFNAWRFDVAFEGTSAYSPSLRLSGTGAAPLLVGTIHLPGVGPAWDISCGSIPVMLEDASITFREAAPRDPTIDVTVTGEVHGIPFRAYAIGPVTQRLLFADCELAQYELTGRAESEGTETPLRLDDLSSEALAAIHLAPWPRIEGAPAPEPASTSEIQ